MKDIVRIGLRIPYELNTWLILEAEKMGFTKNAFVTQILWAHFKNISHEGGEKGENKHMDK